MFTRAITREPGFNFAQGITTADLGLADYDLMLTQHRAYVQTLRDLGLDVLVLDPLPEHPDAYFVEDVAVATPELAVITHPGAASRQGEENAIEPILAQFCPTACIRAPATIEGGDVLLVGRHFLIGLSERTNPEGARQLGQLFEPLGYTFSTVPVSAGLHFKSSVNYVGKNTLLVSEAFAGHPALQGFSQIVMDNDEAYAANCLWVNDTLVVPKGFPKTRARLESLGLPIVELDVSEARKMDGGLTCMSLRF